METLDGIREAFIQKLERTAGLFQQLFEKDPNEMIIGYDDRAKLKDLQKRNENVLKKLKSKEFSVAVVGLEKAGKSTLGNALIKSVVLPEYTERCTYTTTEIRNGANDEAEIFFYSREEFNNDFKKLLNSLGYSGNADFESMNIETFNRYWSAVEGDESKKGIFMIHNGTTVEDIRKMLNNKNEILPFLGSSPKKFVGQEEWRSRDFQIFITGFKGKGSGGVIRGAQPYAVKNVIIHSTHLGEMENLVLYDVPGFDSPTDLHKKQTEKMLSAADAIILVTNAGTNPNLVGTQIDMLRKVRDDDGIRLNEKSFVFGNKVDLSGNAQHAKDNIAALINDAANKYQIATQARVICGSSKAYLESNKIFSQDDEERGLTGADKTLENWSISFGIEELREKMQDYYDTDRFKVLKTRAEKTLSDTENLLQEILEKYTPEVLDNIDNGYELTLEIKDKVNDFIRAANKIGKNHQLQISREKPFSSNLITEIENIYPLSEKFQQLIEDIENSQQIDIDRNYPLTTVNVKLREALQMQFLNNLVDTAANITGDKQKEIHNDLIQKFLEILGVSSSSFYRDELEKSVNNLFEEFLKDKGSKCTFNSLIERFALNPIETLIRTPFAEYDRYDKVCLSLPELFSLAAYYTTVTTTKENEDYPQIEDNPSERLKFFEKILAHEGISADNPNTAILKKIFKDNEDSVTEGGIKDIDAFPYDRWADDLSKRGIDLSTLPETSRNEFINELENVFYKHSWRNCNIQERTERIDKVIKDFCDTQKAEEHKNLNEQLSDLYEKSKSRSIKNKAEMISTLDADILILRDVTELSVVKAIGLERAFISAITKNINIICDKISNSDEGRKIFNAWIKQNIRKIKDSEFARIEQDNMNNQSRKIIVESIKQVLDKLEV